MRLNNLSRWRVQMRNWHYYLLLIGISWSGVIAMCVAFYFLVIR